mgnify:FL=1
MRKLSAVSAVKLSGFELVRKQPRNGKLASERGLAKLDWTPWVAEEEGRLQPSDTALMNCGVPARFAYATLLKSRAELIAMHAKADHGHVDKLMASWAETAEWLKSLVAMLDAAYLRVMASAAAHNQAGGKFPGVHDMRSKARRPRRATRSRAA